jgi:predicted  nucleic acid-binding Zn-ribbon protein
LQEVDLKLTEVETKLAALEVETREPQAAIQKMETLAKKAHDGLATVQREVHSREGEVADLRLKLKKANEKLLRAVSAKGLEAVQHEISGLEEKIDAAEEVELEVMEREEEARAMADRITTGILQLGEKIEVLDATREERRSELETQAATIRVDQAKWRGYLPEETLARYDKARVRAKGRRVVVEVDVACPACDRIFTSSERMGFMNHADRIHDCPECKSLMLYIGAVAM